MQVDLHNQVALVTGAARGIGQAIGDALARNGATVIYTDVDEADARDAAARQDGAHALALNVTDEAQVEVVFAHVREKFGRLDILVNNAGVNTLAHRVNINEFPVAEWHRLINVDLTGLFLVSRAGSQLMVEQKRGRIINIASVVGLVPLRLQSPFAAAKAGVINLTRATAIELGSQGVLCNAIAPGSIETDGTRKLFYSAEGTFNSSVQQLMDHIPLGRPGQADEIACAALFLAAPENSYMTGHTLVVDGGWTAGYSRDF